VDEDVLGKAPKMTLREFYNQLQAHDWYYDFSDSGEVWRAGVKDRKRLEEISKESREHRQLYLKFKEYVFSGESFGTKQKRKPHQPK
jgi:hypothetical protein